MDTAATREFLRAQMANRPESRLQDLCKALYQSTFGCGHLISDVAAAEQSIREELAAGVPSCRDIEPLDGLWDRVPLGILAGVLTPSTLARAFALSAAMPREDTAALEARLDVLRELLTEGALPITPQRRRQSWHAGQAAGYPACHHSADYRAAYHRPTGCCTGTIPICCRCWRPLTVRWQRRSGCCWPLRAALPAARPRYRGSFRSCTRTAPFSTRMISSSGRSSGRPERFAQPGGNMDRERLEAEVLVPLRRGEAAVYRPFDCGTMTLRPPVTVRPARLNIVEGAYSLHPSLEKYYDLSVFLDVTPETQRRRILSRNGAEWGQRFFERWIPLETAYFQETATVGALYAAAEGGRMKLVIIDGQNGRMARFLTDGQGRRTAP